MSALIESLLKCRVDKNVVHLPPISEGALPNYPEVKKALLNSGAKYQRNTFVFPSDAQPFIDRLTGGESINIKKEFQFFATPDSLANKMVELAEIDHTHSILEPSAGQGAIIKAINKKLPHAKVHCFELMPQNKSILEKIQTAEIVGEDFLAIDTEFEFDRIVANPPFTKNQDIDHIKKMYEVLKEGGRLVSVASPSWTFGSQKKQVEFREWLSEIGATVEELPEGTFKESGTSIRAMLIVIDKAA